MGTGSTPSISRMSSNLSSMSGGSAGNGGGPMPLNFSLEEVSAMFNAWGAMGSLGAD